EVMLIFDSDIDSLTFGQVGTHVENLLFVSHNAGRVAPNGAVQPGSELTMVDTVTLQQVALATGGTRGGAVATTSDGRVLLSQTSQVDVLNPIVAPSVISTSPPPQSVTALPLTTLTVTFDQDMLVGDETDAASVINPANYTLADDKGIQSPIR